VISKDFKFIFFAVYYSLRATRCVYPTFEEWFCPWLTSQ